MRFGVLTEVDLYINTSAKYSVRPSRPALRPTQPPVQWVRGSFLGVKYGRGVLLTTHTILVPWSWRS